MPPSKLTLPEGPFGEFTSYYAADARPLPGNAGEGNPSP